MRKSTTALKDNDYINGLLQHNQKVINQIYESYFDRIKHLVLKNGGTSDDAKDVFQEALVVIYNKAKEEDFELSSQFFTYLFGICRFIWLNIRKKKANTTVTLESDETYTDTDSSIETAIIQQERYKIYEDNFQKLGFLCKKILSMFFVHKSMTEIAEAINYKTPHSVRTKKYKCQEQLKKLIKSDQRFSDFNLKRN